MSKKQSNNKPDVGVIPADTLLEVYKTMVQSRFLDERVWQLNRQGRAALVASSQGHEAVQSHQFLRYKKVMTFFTRITVI